MELLGLRFSTARCTSLRAHLCLLLSVCLLNVTANSNEERWMRKLPSPKQTTWNSHHLLARRSRTPTVEGAPRCADPGVPENGRRIDSVTVLYVGLSLRFACNSGFLLRGSEVLTCQYGEWNEVEWNADLPQCVAQIPLDESSPPDPCGLPPDPSTFAFTVSYVPGESVGYSCLDGYVPQLGSEQLTCREGQWQGLLLQCRRIGRCRDHGNIANGRRVLEGTRENDTVHFMCNEGYLLYGNRQVSCGKDGSWTGDWPECTKIPVNCGDPGTLTNGRRFVAGTIEGSSVKFQCNHGYALRGESKRECLPNGEWSGQAPSCKRVRCGTPLSPKDGEVSYETTEYGAQAVYSCKQGFVLSGATETTCVTNGSWSDPPPKCTRVECGVPRRPSNGNVRFRNTMYSYTASYSCLGGYGLVGPTMRTCQADGTWSGDTPSCQSDVCGTLSDPPNGQVTVIGMMLGGTAVYSCDPGYQLSDPARAQRTCGLFGMWTGEAPTCKAITCIKLSSTQHTSIATTNKNFYNSVAEYTCHNGYIMVGGHESMRRQCQANGLWTGNPNYCYRVRCDDLDAPHNGGVVMSGNGLGDEGTYSCNDNYQLMFGDQIRTCTETGLWSGIEPCCIRKEVFCEQLSDPPTSTVVVTGVQAGDRAEYTCNEGLDLVGGSMTRVCLPAGVWSGQEPTCSVTCPRLSAPTNGSVRLEGNRPGDKAVYSCDPGNVLKGGERVCLEDGTWSGVPSECTPLPMDPKFCFNLTSPQNGLVDLSQGVGTGAVAMYSCNHGYVLNGKPNRTCGVNGMWSGTAPTCQPIDCGPLTPPTNGAIDVNSTTLGSTAIYECDFGYDLTGPSVRECLSNGSWSREEPVCQSIDCGPLTPPTNGAIEVNSTTLGSTAIYECDFGYDLTGPSVRECLSDGSWSREEPICQSIDCGPLTPPTNGAIQVNSTTLGSTAIYECDFGYDLTGPSVRECLSDSSWSREEPICQLADCGGLDSPTNGIVVFSGTTFGSQANYSCNSLHRLVGPNSRECTEEGVWSDTAPTCIALQCPELVSPTNGVVATPTRTVGSVATYRCNTGYNLVGLMVTVCLATEMWSSEPPVCQLITCPALPPIENGEVEISANTVGGEAVYRCDLSLALNGASIRTCMENGEWSGVEPVCVVVECPVLSPPLNGRVIATGNAVGDSVLNLCDSGYVLDGLIVRLCEDDGRWSGEEPRCVRPNCDGNELTNPVNGMVTFSTTTIGSTATYTCDVGYRLEGVSTRMCDVIAGESRWSGTTPICQMITCPALPPIENGEVEISANTVGGEAVYRCDLSLALNGASVRTCMENGEWSGVEPVCVVVECPVLSPPLNGRVIVTGNAVGDTVLYLCDSGYVVDGLIVRLCEDDGRWSGEEPRCVRPNCDGNELTNPVNGMVTFSTTTIGSTATYTCDVGYRLEGVSTRMCDVIAGESRWSGTTPICQKIVCPSLSNPINGRVLVTHMCFGGGALYICNVGFTLSAGTVKRTCREDSQWDGVEPVCEPSPGTTVCPALFDPPNGEVQIPMSTTTVGSRVSYTCNHGYLLSGPSTRECMSDGSWTGTEPACTLIDCGPLENPANGTVSTLGGTTLSQLATYFCDEAYKLIGLKSRVCVSPGIWSGSAPSCQLIDCGSLDPPMNGRVETPQGTTFGSEALYSCRAGYEVNGASVRECTESEDWSGSEPTCSPIGAVPNSCGDPGTPENGDRMLTVTTVGSTVQYSCDEGYTPMGDVTRVCMEDLRWSGDLPTCELVMCPLLPEPENGFIIDSGRAVGSRANYFCNHGYSTRRTDVILRVCLPSGEWSGTDPMCISDDSMDCEALPDIANGNVAMDTLRVGAVAEYTCDPGFTLTGPSSRTCLSGGEWSDIDSEPFCTRVRCENPPAPLNGRVVIGDTSTAGSRAYFVCDDGFQRQGLAVVQCTGNSSWSSPIPTCRASSNQAPNGSCSDGESVMDFAGRLCQCVNGKLTSCCRYRRDWTSLSQAAKQLYIDTVKTVSSNPDFQPLYNELVRRYQESFNTLAQDTVPETSLFVPWHRYFLLEYEDLLRMVDPSITIPYWDWSVMYTRPYYESPVFDPKTGFGNSADNVSMCVTSGPFREGEFVVAPSAGSTCLMRKYDDFQYPSRGFIESDVLPLTAVNFSQFHNSIQLLFNLNVRCNVGGHMCTSNAANDPLYLLQLSRIDLIVDRWQAMDEARATARYANNNNPLVLTFDDSLTASDFSNNSALPYGVCVKYSPLQSSEEEDPGTAIPSSGPGLPTVASLQDPTSTSDIESDKKRSVGANIDCTLASPNLSPMEEKYLRKVCGLHL